VVRVRRWLAAVQQHLPAGRSGARHTTAPLGGAACSSDSPLWSGGVTAAAVQRRRHSGGGTAAAAQRRRHNGGGTTAAYAPSWPRWPPRPRAPRSPTPAAAAAAAAGQIGGPRRQRGGGVAAATMTMSGAVGRRWPASAKPAMVTSSYPASAVTSPTSAGCARTGGG
jgi:hypothetical protein